MANRNFRKGWLQSMLIQDRSGSVQQLNKQGCYCIQNQPVQDELDDGTNFVRILVSLYASKSSFKQRIPPLNQSPFVYTIYDSTPATDGVSASLLSQYFSSGDIWTNSINFLNTVTGSEPWNQNRSLNLAPVSVSNPSGSMDAGT